jgi:hypothetical protein
MPFVVPVSSARSLRVVPSGRSHRVMVVVFVTVLIDVTSLPS